MPLVETMHLWGDGTGIAIEQLDVRGCRGLRSLKLYCVLAKQLFMGSESRPGVNLGDIFIGLEAPDGVIDLPSSLADCAKIHINAEPMLYSIVHIWTADGLLASLTR